jgi:lipid II:glycine glycyltransferase (peptidoglycan interpeptide bridge formation enzyme)
LGAQSSDHGWLVSERFVLPFYVDKILIFRRLIFTTAPITKDADAVSSAVELQVFLDTAVELVRQNRLCDFISKPQSNAVFAVAPQKGIFGPWGTYETYIARSDDELLKAFHSKHRNVINKAIRDGVIVKDIPNLCVVQENIRDTLLRQKLPYYPSIEFIQNLYTGLHGKVLVMGAFYQEQLQGVALVPFDVERGYYLYGGSIEAPYAGALNLLQYEIMRLLRDKGVQYYDFVGARIEVEPGSKYEGIQRFKSRFGAELRKGVAFRVVFSPLKFSLFNLMIRLYFMLKGRRYVDPIDQIRANIVEKI